ncbi:MAG: hypothetical protein ACREQ5_32240, partial [Candidatus Dormibacteria bacterium]
QYVPVVEFNTSDTRLVIPSSQEFQNIVFSMQDNTWWVFNTQQDINFGLRFATSFPAPIQGNYYTQYAFLNSFGTNGFTGSPGTDWVYQFAFGGNKYFDQTPEGTGSFPVATTFPILCVAQTSMKWFDNERRKRVLKAKIIRDTFIDGSGIAGTVSGYLTYTRSMAMNPTGPSTTYTDVSTRQIPLTNSQVQGRYYANNLGMGRAWTFNYTELSNSNLRLYDLELECQQGTT